MVLSNDMKKAIAFGLIFGAIISIFSVFGYCVEDETINFTGVLQGYMINVNDVIGTSTNYNLYYLAIEPGYIYTLSFNGTSTVGFGDSLSVGSSVFDKQVMHTADTLSFTYNDYSFLYFYSVGSDTAKATITREKLEGLPNFVDNIAFALNYVNLNNIVANVVPILAIGVLLGLGFYLLKRILNKIKRAKGGA